MCPGVSKAMIIIMIFQPSVDSKSCMVNDCAFSEAMCRNWMSLFCLKLGMGYRYVEGINKLAFVSFLGLCIITLALLPWIIAVPQKNVPSFGAM